MKIGGAALAGTIAYTKYQEAQPKQPVFANRPELNEIRRREQEVNDKRFAEWKEEQERLQQEEKQAQKQEIVKKPVELTEAHVPVLKLMHSVQMEVLTSKADEVCNWQMKQWLKCVDGDPNEYMKCVVLQDLMNTCRVKNEKAIFKVD